MFGFDIFPIADASLPMTADLTLLLFGLCSLLWLSAAGIAISALWLWLRSPQRMAVIPTMTAFPDLTLQEQSKAA